MHLELQPTENLLQYMLQLTRRKFSNTSSVISGHSPPFRPSVNCQLPQKYFKLLHFHAQCWELLKHLVRMSSLDILFSLIFRNLVIQRWISMEEFWIKILFKHWVIKILHAFYHTWPMLFNSTCFKVEWLIELYSYLTLHSPFVVMISKIMYL